MQFFRHDAEDLDAALIYFNDIRSVDAILDKRVCPYYLLAHIFFGLAGLVFREQDAVNYVLNLHLLLL